MYSQYQQCFLIFAIENKSSAKIVFSSRIIYLTTANDVNFACFFSIKNSQNTRNTLWGIPSTSDILLFYTVGSCWPEMLFVFNKSIMINSETPVKFQGKKEYWQCAYLFRCLYVRRPLKYPLYGTMLPKQIISLRVVWGVACNFCK